MITLVEGVVALVCYVPIGVLVMLEMIGTRIRRYDEDRMVPMAGV